VETGLKCLKITLKFIKFSKPEQQLKKLKLSHLRGGLIPPSGGNPVYHP
jgi:hypothetical protein